MPRIYCRLSKNNQTKYYSDVHINGKRVRKHLADNPKSARMALKKLEYQLIFNPVSKDPKHKDIPLNHAIISFLKEIEASGVSDHRVKTIRLKLNTFSKYCYKPLLSDITVRIAKNYMHTRANARVTNK